MIYFEMRNTKCNIPFGGTSETKSRVKSANQSHTDIKNIYRRVTMGNTQKSAKFTKDDLAFLMTYAGVQKSSLKSWCKKFRKECPTGKVTPKVFQDVCHLFFPYINAIAFSRYIFYTFDTEQKGWIPITDVKIVIQAMDTGNGDGIFGSLSSNEKLKWTIILHDMWIVFERLNKIVSVK